MSLRRRALFLLGLFVAVSCSDAGNPLEPKPIPDPEDYGQALQCTVVVSSGTMRCTPPEPNAGGALAAGQIQLGGINGQYVDLTAANFLTDATSLSFQVTVENLLRQPLGTSDGTTPHADGVRIWLTDDAVVAMPGGTANVDNAAATGVAQRPGASGPTAYLQVNQVLDTNETSAPTTARFRFTHSGTPPTDSVRFWVYVVAEVEHPNGWIEITPAESDLAPGGTVDLSAIAYHKQADIITNVSQDITFSSNRPGVATVNSSTGLVTASSTADSVGVVTITATNTTGQSGTATVVVNTDPIINPQTFDAVTNVTIHAAAPGVLAGATDDDASQTLTVVPADSIITTQGGVAWIQPDGELEYVGAAGFSGTDVINFQVTDGLEEFPASATVEVDPSNYWYVKANAGGDGRDHHPFSTLALAQAQAGAGDSILVLHTAGQDVIGNVALEANQAVLGQGIPASITLTLNSETVTVLAAGASSSLASAAGDVITLGTDNTIRGVSISAASGSAIAGTGFSSLTASDLAATATGPVLNLTTGFLNTVVFTTLSSTSSAGAGLSLTGVTGSLTSTGGSITGATGTAVNVSGGSVSLTYGGNVTKGNAGLLLNVSGNHATGTLAFNGTLTATAGSGLSFNDADGTYNFNGTTTLSGGPAVAIGNGSDGVFSFGANTDITNSTGTAFDVNGSTPTVTYSGDISQGNNVLLVSVAEQTADSVIFNTGTLSATNGQGIFLSNADGVVRFNGTTTLNGGDAGVDVVAGSDGTIAFGAGASINNGTGTGLNVFESAPTLSFAGSISTSAGRPVSVDGASPCGTITVGGSITSTGQGILVQDCSTGTISLTGAKTLTTGANTGVTLSNNAGVTAIGLTGGALNITTTAATGILGNGAAGFGSLTVSNASLSATGGPALNLTTGTLSGTFSSLSSTNSTGAGVSLTTVNGSLNTSGGSITGAAGTAFNVSGGNVGGTIATSITQNNNASTLAVAGGHTGTLTFSAAVSAGNGNGLQFTDADGTYTFTGNFTLNGAGDEGIDIAAASSGTVNVTPSGGNTAAITSPSGIAIAVTGGSADLNYSGNVTQASNAALLSVSGGHTGDLAFPTGTLNASNGNGLQFDNADGTYDFDGTVTLNGGDAGIDVTNGSGGTFTFPTAATITSPSTGNLISILNSAPNFTYSGGLTKANNNVTGILISSNTGGTITFNGDATSADGDPADVARSISSGTAAGVSLVSNGSASILFAGGGLNITTSSGTGFNATGSGTVQVTGAGNVILSGTGTAVNLSNIGTGASGISFRSVTHSGGANGIAISTVTTGAGFQVTGDGATSGSGGSINNTTGGDGASAGNGVYLSQANNISLAYINLSAQANNGVYASSVNGLTMNKLRITGNNGTSNSAVFSESGIQLVNVSGTVSLTNSAVSGGAYNNMTLNNTAGSPSLTSMTVATDTFGTMQGTAVDMRNHSLAMIVSSGTATIAVQNSQFTYWWGTGVQAAVQGVGAATVTVTGNNVSNSNPDRCCAASGIAMAGGALTYTISSNNVQNSVGAAIAVDESGSSPSTLKGTVSGNTIGTSGVANSGSSQGSAISLIHAGAGTSTHAVTNNVIRQINGSQALLLQIGDASAGGGNGTYNVTVTGNNIQEAGSTVNTGRNAIAVTVGTVANDAHQACVDIGGAGGLANNITNFNPNPNENRLRPQQRFLTTVRMPGYTGANNNNGQVGTYLLGRNVATQVAATNNVASGGGGFVNTAPAGSACPQP